MTLLLRLALCALPALLAWGAWAYVRGLQADVATAELRAATAETRAGLAEALKPMEITHAIALAAVPAVPFYARGLERMCEQWRMRPAAPAGGDDAHAQADAGNRPPGFAELAADLAACKANAADQTLDVQLLDQIYEANPQ